MLDWIVKSSLKFRLVVLAVAAGIIVFGIARFDNISIASLPEFAPPYVEVQTEALGLSAAEVEDLVTLNLEEILTAVPWLQSIRSKSVPSLSSVMLVFERGTDLMRARQVVQERLTGALGVAQRVETAGYAPATFGDEQSHDGRAIVGRCVAHRHVRNHTVDDQTEVVGRPRRGQRRGVGAACPAAAGSSQTRYAAQQWAYAQPNRDSDG